MPAEARHRDQPPQSIAGADLLPLGCPQAWHFWRARGARTSRPDCALIAPCFRSVAPSRGGSGLWAPLAAMAVLGWFSGRCDFFLAISKNVSIFAPDLKPKNYGKGHRKKTPQMVDYPHHRRADCHRWRSGGKCNRFHWLRAMNIINP